MMKLAEALIRRADYQKRLEQLRARLHASAKVQEGETPPHDPALLMQEFRQVSEDLTALVGKINAVNAREKFADNMTLSQALAERDNLQRQHAMLRSVISTASDTVTRYSKSEIKVLPAVNVQELQQQADDLARRHRELDTKIQELNWHLSID